jgi:hypothetical protein
VAIDRLLMGSSLDRELLAQLKLAYEATLRALHLVDRNDPITELIAKRVIEVGKRGGDPFEISKLVIKGLGLSDKI